jgi:ribosomal protein L19
MTLRSPEGSGIKGGKVGYHVQRMLAGLALVRAFPLDSEFIERLVVYHAKLAGRAALNQMYNGRRPA